MRRLSRCAMIQGMGMVAGFQNMLVLTLYVLGCSYAVSDERKDAEMEWLAESTIVTSIVAPPGTYQRALQITNNRGHTSTEPSSDASVSEETLCQSVCMCDLPPSGLSYLQLNGVLGDLLITNLTSRCQASISSRHAADKVVIRRTST